MSVKPRLPLVLGITGGVASGKSTVLSVLEKRGACRISADDIARDLLAPGSATTAAVIEAFGPEVAADADVPTVDRKKLARKIFASDGMRAQLNALMHPAIREEMSVQIRSARANPTCSLVAVEIPLLYESGLEAMVDRVLVAVCPEPVQIERLMGRQPWLSKSEALRQVRSQLPLAEKILRATYVIDMNRPAEAVNMDVDTLFDGLVGD